MCQCEHLREDYACQPVGCTSILKAEIDTDNSESRDCSLSARERNTWSIQIHVQLKKHLPSGTELSERVKGLRVWMLSSDL